MTYQEIKERLAKCEFSLKCIVDGTYKNKSKKELAETTKKLTLLKESYIKQLKEAEGTVRTADAGEAEKLADKGVNVDLVEPKDLETNEQEGDSSFDQNETAMLAAEVGKATVLALKDEGENISSARVKRIKPNEFDVVISFKNGSENIYDFYIVGDTLYLKDTSYDREISDVGVKQSGEAIVNVDLVKNELQKYFKTVNTALGEAERVKPVKNEINYKKLVGMTKEEEAQLFWIGKFMQGKVSRLPEDPLSAYYQYQLKTAKPGKEIDLKADETKGAPKGHYFTKSGNLVKGRLTKDARERGARLSDPKDKQRSKVPPVTQYKEGEGDDHHYIKVPRRQYKKAQKVIDDVLRNDVYGGHKHDIVDNDGRGNVIFYFMGPEEKAITYDAVVYLRNSDVDVVDSSISDMEEGDGMTTKIKLSAGDPTNMAYTDKVDETVEQEQAIYDLRAIVEKLEELGDEARDIVKQYFPNEMSRMTGYGVFDLAYSNNRYDVTLGSEVDRLEGGDYDDLDDENYPREAIEDKPLPKGKHSVSTLRKVHGMIVDKMRELNNLRKEKGGDHKYQGGSEPGKHTVMDHLKALTKKKKTVEKALEKAVGDVGKGQQLDPNVNEGRGDMDIIKGIITDRANESGFEEREEAAEVIAGIADEYKLNLKMIQNYMDSDGPVNPFADK